MTLRDAVRERLRGIEANLQAVEARFRALNDERNLAEGRLRDALSEASRVRQETERERAELSRVTDTEQKLQFGIDQLEQQRASLIGQLLIAQQSLQEHRQALGELQERAEKLGGAAKRARDASDELRRRFDELKGVRTKTEGERTPAVAAALRDYLASLEHKIESALELSSRDEEVLRARAGLRAARHSDAGIAALLEERDQYRDLLERATVSAVREKLAGELTRIEAKIEARFPGSLTAQIERPGVMEELYFTEPEPRSHSLYLPVSPRTWQRIEEGDESNQTRQACLLLWHLAAAGLCRGVYDIRMAADLCVLTTDQPVGTGATATLSVPIGSGQSVDMLLERMPDDIEKEILRYEASA